MRFVFPANGNFDLQAVHSSMISVSIANSKLEFWKISAFHIISKNFFYIIFNVTFALNIFRCY